jgi:hypothetical protein
LPREIIQIICKGQHRITRQHIRAAIGDIRRGDGLGHRSVLVEHVKDGQPDLPILLLENLFGDAGRQDRCADIIRAGTRIGIGVIEARRYQPPIVRIGREFRGHYFGEGIQVVVDRAAPRLGAGVRGNFLMCGDSIGGGRADVHVEVLPDIRRPGYGFPQTGAFRIQVGEDIRVRSACIRCLQGLALRIVDIRDEIHVGLRDPQRKTIIQIAGQRIGPIQVGIGAGLTTCPRSGTVYL